ncbi:MAG: hypothetical protein CVU41_09840 [Chloroflexi bacterium HGW-Chloroflexi-3]|nr:MAG: hypothetical protein CVU41_09840 [Chloroflexi bacterium HGW-Chloroflexi-3]
MAGRPVGRQSHPAAVPRPNRPVDAPDQLFGSNSTSHALVLIRRWMVANAAVQAESSPSRSGGSSRAPAGAPSSYPAPVRDPARAGRPVAGRRWRLTG